MGAKILRYEPPALTSLSDGMVRGQNCITGTSATGGCLTGESPAGYCVPGGGEVGCIMGRVEVGCAPGAADIIGCVGGHKDILPG
ncbi:MAG: hypothetical protein N3B01_06050 [Verrucomicrobiae bacterium]|nr:hypothetical protein [Verrucomicrobiae bacterium]